MTEELETGLFAAQNAAQAAPVTEEVSPPATTYTLSNGLVVRLKKVAPTFIQRVTKSVSMPTRPTYTAVTANGREERHVLDEESAMQTPGGEVQWQEYLLAKAEAMEAQNERVAQALFVKGTEMEIPEDGWDVLQEVMGITVPTNPDMRRAHWLLTECDAEDIGGLITAIMRLTGVSAEAIAEAEGSFRSAIRS